MELGLYRQPIIDFQGPKSKGTSRGNVCENFSLINVGKIQLQQQLLHQCHLFFRRTLFSFQLSFAPEQLSTLSTFNRLI